MGSCLVFHSCFCESDIIMKKLFARLQSVNVWIAFILVAMNIIAWQSISIDKCPTHESEPIRDPEVVSLLEHIRSEEDHSGEDWIITLTEQEAEETITWYLHRYPQIPFAYPDVTITPDYVDGTGKIQFGVISYCVGAKVQVTLLENGLPYVKILDLSVPIPNQLVEDELQKQLRRAESLPVRFDSAEWSNGIVVVKGYIR